MDWHTITINGSNETFFISIIKESNNENFVEIQFNLTDFKGLWREKIDSHEMVRRVKSENEFMNVDGEENAIERTIFCVANNYQLISNEDERLLKTKYYKGGVPFHFHWKLTRSSSDVFYEEITAKLLVTLLNVQDQRNELIEIVKRKDVEIHQYKIEGATLARKHMATQPFVKSEFDCKFEMISDTGLFDGSVNCDTIKTMCNYNSRRKNEPKSSNTSNVTDGPSPSKIAKPNKKKEEMAIRKFKAKKDTKIQYENSCELLTSDDNDTEQDVKLRADVQIDTIKNDDRTGDVPKRKLKSKLNL